MKNGLIQNEDGTKFWYLNGRLHREDGPAYESANGDRHWYLNGKLHREDGPAIEWTNGESCWYLNGLKHREDGPAIEHANGSKDWWINGTELTKEEFNQWLMKKELNEKLQTALPPKPIIKRGKI